MAGKWGQEYGTGTSLIFLPQNFFAPPLPRFASIRVIRGKKVFFRARLSRSNGLRIVHAAVEFWGPNGQIIGRIEIVVIPAQFLFPFFAWKAGPGGAFFVHGAGEVLIVFLGQFGLGIRCLDANRHGIYSDFTR